MLINEDYFDKLTISDEDIKDTINNETLPNTVNELFNQMKSKYSKNIRIPLDYVYLETNQKKVLKTLPDILRQMSKRIDNILNFFNIEHSDIYVIYEKLFQQTPKDGTEITKQNGYIQVKHPSIKTTNVRVGVDDYFRVHIDVYVNFPKFSCKDAVRFALMLENGIWNKKFYGVSTYFKIYSEVKELYGLVETENITFFRSYFNIKKLNLHYIHEDFIEAAKTIINCFIGIKTAEYIEDHFDYPDPFNIQPVPNDKTDYEYEYNK